MTALPPLAAIQLVSLREAATDPKRTFVNINSCGKKMRSHSSIFAFLLVSLLLATVAYADDEASPMGVCKDLSIIAREIMTARQEDKPMSETLPAALKLFRDMADSYEVEWVEEAKEAEEGIVELVMAAYDLPSYPVEVLQTREISEFENEVFAECYKGATSDSEE